MLKKEGILKMTKQQPQPGESSTPLWELDGETHINIHFNDSKTALGKMLAPFSMYPFRHPYFGPFKTMEGFLHWLRTGGVDDKFRSLSGHRAREHAKEGIHKKELRRVSIPDLNRVVLLAHYEKINQNLVIKESFLESTLPFDQYYTYGPGSIVIRPPDTERLVATMEELRTMFKSEIIPEAYDYSKLPILKK